METSRDINLRREILALALEEDEEGWDNAMNDVVVNDIEESL